MPKQPENTTENTPDTGKLRSYTHHRVVLTERGSQAFGDCPFCQREDKFTVHTDTGLWRCFVCGTGSAAGGGNPLTFLRTLWERSDAVRDGGAGVIAADRLLLDPGTVTAWGACRSIIDGVWLVPGYSADGKLTQLYRRTPMPGKDGSWKQSLLPTPGVWPDGKVHGLHMASLSHDPQKQRVDIFEGPWDGMAWWETARQCRWQDGALTFTGNEGNSLIADSSVVAVPGCNTFRQEWVAMCRGKDVTLWYDNDHKTINDKLLTPGWSSTKRVVAMLVAVARSIHVLQWGPDGYDPALPDGTDVRDVLTTGATIQARIERLNELYRRIAEPPAEWSNGTATANRRHHDGAEPIPCNRWDEVEAAWQLALRWREELGDVLSVMLAVCASTEQKGDQIFLQVVGDPGSAKTTLCKGLLVSKKCMALRSLNGFYSGWKVAGDDTKDCSLAARMNNHTLVTPEGDVIMSSPKLAELMSQQRELYDGEGGKTFGNDDKSKEFNNLRAPWIMAGTPALMDADQSRVGDRFIKVYINQPSDSEKRLIAASAFDNEMDAVLVQANGATSEPRVTRAHALTGGYVNWLRDNATELLSQIDVPDAAKEAVLDFAEFAADMRARPNMDPKKHEVTDSKELPTRLTRQFARLARCLAVVLNRRTIDDDVLRRLRKVAFDTSRGRSLELVRLMHKIHPRTQRPCQEQGLMLGDLQKWWSQTHEDKIIHYLQFLRKVGVVRYIDAPGTRGWWKLTDRVCELYKKVIGD